jgi:hypothetical protein
MKMNKKIALVTLIEASFLLSSGEKLALLDTVPTLNDKQVQALGTMLAKERAVMLANEDAIMTTIQKHLEAMREEDDDNKVYVGTGKPS